jgi:hypothetical protein
VGKSLTVNEMFRRQAKARRRLAVAVQAPFVLYYQLTDSIHAPSSARLDVRWFHRAIQEGAAGFLVV